MNLNPESGILPSTPSLIEDLDLTTALPPKKPRAPRSTAKKPRSAAKNPSEQASSKPASKARTRAAKPEVLAPAPHEAQLALMLTALDDAKAEEIITIDLRGRTSLADAMIIASGRSNRHVGSIVHRVIELLKAAGYGPLRSEGEPQCDWVLLDAGDIILHVFRPEVRAFYNLEKMWSSDRPAEQAQEPA